MVSGRFGGLEGIQNESSQTRFCDQEKKYKIKAEVCQRSIFTYSYSIWAFLSGLNGLLEQIPPWRGYWLYNALTIWCFVA